MRFITPEIVKANLSEYLSELYKTTDIKKEAEQDTAGNNLPRVSKIMQENTKPAYTYGSTQLYYLYESINYDDTSGRTIADLSSDINGSITNYTGLSTEGFTWQFQNWINTNKPFKTSFWWTIITDQGIIFTKPERQTSSNQIATFKVVSHNDRTDNLDNVSYQGETGADIYISANVDMAVPDTLDSTLKTMTINKFKSANDVVIIRSQYDANPLDYIVYNNNTYLVINKKQLTAPTALKALYEYICIREVTDTYTITGSDETPPAHPLIGTTAGGGGGINISLRSSEQTLVNVSGVNADTSYTFNLENKDGQVVSTDSDTSGVTRYYFVRIKMDHNYTAGGFSGTRFYLSAGSSASTSSALIGDLYLNSATPASLTIDLMLPLGTYTIFADYRPVSGAGNFDLLVKAKEV
jgi:hypothetical protein